MSKLAVLTVLASAVTASVAHAQAPGETAPLTALTQPSGDVGPKDPGTAVELSIGGTLASAAVFVLGVKADSPELAMGALASSLVTPSLGEWYAGKPLTAGMGIRVVSAAVEFAGLSEAFKCVDEEDSGCSNNNNAAGLMILGGLVGYAAGTIYDIADAGSSAREYNRAHSWRVTPTMMRTASGTAQMGVGIGGTF